MEWKEDPDEFDVLIDRMERSAFVLLADDPVNYENYRKHEERITSLYGMQIELFVQKTTWAYEPGSPEPMTTLLADALERVGLLSRRALRGEERLEAWFDLGCTLADFTRCGEAKLGDDSRPEPRWDLMIGPLSRLPQRDKEMVIDILDTLDHSPTRLAPIRGAAYRMIADCASQPEADQTPLSKEWDVIHDATAAKGGGTPREDREERTQGAVAPEVVAPDEKRRISPKTCRRPSSWRTSDSKSPRRNKRNGLQMNKRTNT